MKRLDLARKLAMAAALVPAAMSAAAAPSEAGVFIGLSVGFAPPAIPLYVQPPCPAPGYLWTPGYWNYANDGYYWVPGAWAEPPVVGLLWTPPYWGYDSGLYGFHPGYWGSTVGFYGGVDYGFGYGGSGFGGGYWQGSNFYYNRAVSNVNVTNIHNTYVNNTYVYENNSSHVSYNGGPGGTAATPTAEQRRFAGEQHYAATANQRLQSMAARRDGAQYASANGGRPATFATDRSGFGYRNEVNARQGDQQSRIAHGVRGGGITPGEERNLERRDDSISNEARSERAANGGYLTGAQRQQLNGRQNRVSDSIYDDRHNANDDAAAGDRRGASAQQERAAARQEHRQERPRGPEDGGGDGRR